MRLFLWTKKELLDDDLISVIGTVSQLKSLTISIPYQYMRLSILTMLQDNLPSTLKDLTIRSLPRTIDWYNLSAHQRDEYIQVMLLILVIMNSRLKILETIEMVATFRSRKT